MVSACLGTLVVKGSRWWRWTGRTGKCVASWARRFLLRWFLQSIPATRRLIHRTRSFWCTLDSAISALGATRPVIWKDIGQSARK